MVELTGTLRGLLLFDVGESIDLAQLRNSLGATPGRREPAFRHPTPEYVRFQRPPVNQSLGRRHVLDHTEVEARIRYFDYGVASVELQLPFQCNWDALIALAHRWMLSPELEEAARKLLSEAIAHVLPAVCKPYKDWVAEDYYIVQVDSLPSLSADQLLADHGSEIAQIVRGETSPLAKSEQAEVLHSSLSYYPTDLLVLGWVGAFLYDSREAAAPTIEILEYANSQLLEFRYYDDVLTGVLKDVYKQFEERRTMWARWKMARRAESLNTIRLDYEELVEGTENAIKFLSDMFYARMYRLAAARIGVSDYQNLVTEKLRTARDLYESMVNEFHQGRAFFLEVMVVLILMIEIVFAFLHRQAP